MDAGQGAGTPGAAGDGGDEPGGLPLGVVVPDDASALEGDRLAWLAEVRAAQEGRPGRTGTSGRTGATAVPVPVPRTGWRRLVLTRRWDRFGLSGPVVALCLLATGLVAALAVVLVPGRAGLPEAAPLAAAAARPVPEEEPGPQSSGETGTQRLDHLLPDVRLQTPDGPVDAVSARPAVLVLLPDRAAAWAPLVTVLREQAALTRVRLWVVVPGKLLGDGPDDVDPALRDLVADLPAGTYTVAADPVGRLGRAVGVRGATVVLVRDDGRVATILREVPADGSAVPGLQSRLAVLDPPQRG